MLSKVIINGKEYQFINNPELTYEQICAIAHPAQFTVTVSHKKKAGGSILAKGEKVTLEDGLVIDCVMTDKA